MLFNHFWLLVYCSIFTPGFQYCYNNPFADITLNGGEPDEDSPYSVVDWYTWSGWLEAFGFHMIINGLKNTLMMFIILGAALTLMLTTNVPFCVDGDYMLFGLDMCQNLTFLKLWNETLNYFKGNIFIYIYWINFYVNLYLKISIYLFIYWLLRNKT